MLVQNMMDRGWVLRWTSSITNPPGVVHSSPVLDARPCLDEWEVSVSRISQLRGRPERFGSVPESDGDLVGRLVQLVEEIRHWLRKRFLGIGQRVGGGVRRFQAESFGELARPHPIASARRWLHNLRSVRVQIGGTILDRHAVRLWRRLKTIHWMHTYLCVC